MQFRTVHFKDTKGGLSLNRILIKVKFQQYDFNRPVSISSFSSSIWTLPHSLSMDKHYHAYLFELKEPLLLLPLLQLSFFSIHFLILELSLKMIVFLPPILLSACLQVP